MALGSFQTAIGYCVYENISGWRGSLMQPRQISPQELTAHNLSFNDYNAKLFKWNGSLCRGIRPQFGQLCRDLFERGIVQSLVEKKLLIETELTSWEIPDYELVLKHRQLPFVSYPWEWCDLMLQDAALLHLDLCWELDRYGLSTGDGHPLNILFDGCQPIFIDFGSIECRSPSSSYWAWAAYEQFCHFFLNPLKLMSQGKGRVARWLLHDYEQGVMTEDLEALTLQARSQLEFAKSQALKAKSWLIGQIPPPAISKLQRLVAFAQGKRNLASISANPRSEFLRSIRQEILGFDLSTNEHQADLTIDWIEPTQTQEVSDSRRQQVIALLSQLQPTSILEIDSYQEQPLAITVASQGSQIVFLTPQEDRARKLYSTARNQELSILPLLFNFISPSCDLGNRWFAPASDRLRCDLVLGLDLIDRLVFKQYLTFATIVERLAIFCDRWLLVEFIIRKDPYRRQWSTAEPGIDSFQRSENMASRFTWYRLDNFIASLEQKFNRVDILCRISDTRILLLCEK